MTLFQYILVFIFGSDLLSVHAATPNVGHISATLLKNEMFEYDGFWFPSENEKSFVALFHDHCRSSNDSLVCDEDTFCVCSSPDGPSSKPATTLMSCVHR